MISMRRILLVAAALAVWPYATSAQRLDVKTINFDLWCQETQHLPPERCDKRTPEDEAAFEAYRDKVEKYEVPYLQGQQNGLQLDRAILHKDPVDNPVTQDPSAQRQAPGPVSTSPQP
jgi:hypothetical protein